MTLEDLECQNKGFYQFFRQFWAATQVYIIHTVAPRNYRYAIYTVSEKMSHFVA